MSFLKVDGAGNDFVLIDQRGVRPEERAWLTRERIRRLLDRRRGIGGDGLLALRPGSGRTAVPVVRFWNPDGSAAAFCGNGARCVGRYLLGQPKAGECVRFRLGRVEVAARRYGAQTGVLVPIPSELVRPAARPPISGAARGAWFDAGVPHWIVPVRLVESVDPASAAPALRAWAPLGPGGTNVDFVEIRDGEVWVRTFERGVEGETLACGSGLTAAGFWAATRGGVPYPVRLRTHGGDCLRLERDPENERRLWLIGPARIVFSGRLQLG